MYQTEEDQKGFVEQNTEATKTGMAIPALQYGFITSLGLIALTLIIYFVNLQSVKWVSWLGYFILIVALYLGSKAYRDEYNGGFITYGRALGFGTLLSVFAALILAVFTYVFYKFIAPDALNTIREIAEEQILRTNPNISDEQIDMALKFGASPGIITFGTLFGYAFVGFILSLITSALVQRKDPDML